MGNLFDRLLPAPHADARRFAILPDGAMFTYGNAVAGAARYAAALTGCGVAPGDRVAVQARKSIDVVLLYLGCLRAGAVFLPLNTAYSDAEIAPLVADAEPALFVCDDDRVAATAKALAAFPVRIETLDGAGGGTLGALAATRPADFATVARADDDLAALLYTSGTTGRSKGAMLSHDNLASNAFALRDAWRFTADDVLLHALPIFHTHGLFVAINVVLAAGAAMRFLPGFEVDTMLAELPHASVMMGVPTFYTRLLADARFDRAATRHMRLFVSGSAPLPADVHRAFAARTGHAILERYGMTETSINSSNPYDGERRAGTVGRPLPGVDVRIVDPASGEQLPDGEVGSIEIAGRNVFKGYWREPDRTAAEFRGDYFVSGDLGAFDTEGYLAIVGREKDLIIAGGLNVYPAEVETALGAFDEVAEVAVIGVPHPDLGEGVVAVVVPRAQQRIDATALMLRLGRRIARFKQPRRIIIVDELPRNIMGKIQKAVLRERYTAIFSE